MILLFREGTYGVLADISKAFLRIGVDEADRDFCRFLFFTSADMKEIQAFRFKVVLFGATCSPYLLNQTIEHHLETYDHPLTTKLKSAFYVDNLQLTYESPDEITIERPQIEQILNQANMPLDQWASNATIEGFEHNGVRDYLGLRWDTERDMLGVAMPHQFKEAFEHPLLFKTKRKILSLFSSLYDPVGFLAPITLTGKLFIQSLWKTEEGWDTPLNGDSIRALPTILNNYRNLDTLRFPRNAHPGTHHALHIFCDASQRGFGVAAYTVSREGHVSFLTGRSRVAPKSMDKLSEELTIPRLELTAILFGSRLAKYLTSLRPSHYHTTFVWSDAKSALFWVRNQTSTSTYVLNRAREIKQLIQDHNLHLRHVSSKDNPADLASKGTNVAGLSNRQDLWFKGPAWLPHPEQYPPQELDALPILIHANPTMVHEAERPFNMTPFRDLPEAYNAFRILLKAVRAKATATVRTKLYRSPMQVMLRIAQVSSYPRIYRHLQGRATQLNSDDKNLIYQRGLKLDEQGLIRCQPPHAATHHEYGRAPPLLLHPKCPLWSRIVLHQHRLALHTNTATLHVLLRRDYWVSRQRQTIKSLLRQCLHCRRVQSPPFRFPPPARLHPNRVHFSTPFSTTGVDFTGAIKLKQSHVDAAYVVIFTCASIRALVLEVVTSLSVADFLRALRRFAARVGMPHSFVSDNAANFGATNRLLRELKEEPSIDEFLTHHHSSWTFITPLAPWQGGMYERLVGITKSNLKKALYKHTPTYDEFRTLCQEVECVVNNRPLTYVDTEEDTPLTPNHLMYGRTIALSPQVQLTELNDPDYHDATTLRTQYQFLTEILRNFKRRWTHDYVASLRERHLRHYKPPQNVPRVHDLVLLILDGVPRDQYPLARITQVFPGPDDVIRSVRVRTAKGEYERSVTRIIPLEINLNTDTPPRSHADRHEPTGEPLPPAGEGETDTVDNGTSPAASDPTEITYEHEYLTTPPTLQPRTASMTDVTTRASATSLNEPTAAPSTGARPRRTAAQRARNWFSTLDE
ncbi:uncharacterized protein LOC143022849 [Oratosquilla oratoria]|uniref:uncharacterized protein LOC143022849 n=1 Tax=Oratosquilla oratoria TaxID=337810 RepID=UPI003F76FDE3